MIKKSIARLAAILAFASFSATASEALAETYTFTAPTYGAPGGFISNWVPGACGAPNCFTSAMTVSGSFTTAAPLPPSATTAVVPLSYSFDSGLSTIANTDPDARIIAFSVTTNGAGAIISSNIHVHRWLSAAHGIGDQVDSIRVTLAEGQGNRRASCSAVAADVCTIPGGGPNLSHAETPNGAWSAPPPATIPTLSEWAMILLGTLLAGGAALALDRRQGLSQRR